MKNALSKNKFNIVSSVLTIAVAALAKKGIDKTYEATTGNIPPKNPEAENASLKRVVLYAAATAAVAVTAKILMRQLLTSQWKKHEGELPETLK